MIRIAVVEDEKIFADQMKVHLKQYGQERGVELKVSCFEDGSDLVEGYAGDCDIILMDIKMHFLNGMDAAEQIRTVDPEVIIIFITNMAQYAIKGYEVGALDYILKPINYFSLQRCLDKAIARLTRPTERYLLLPLPEETRKISVRQISYIESLDHRLTVHTTTGNYTIRGTMQGMEEELAVCPEFFRCGKGYLVNLQYVEAVREGCAILAGDSVPISRSKKTAFMTALMGYLNGGMK